MRKLSKSEVKKFKGMLKTVNKEIREQYEHIADLVTIQKSIQGVLKKPFVYTKEEVFGKVKGKK